MTARCLENNTRSALQIKKYDAVQEDHYLDYIQEWEQAGEQVVPYAARRAGRSFSALQKQWAVDETDQVFRQGFVPASLYFLVTPEDRLLGAIHLRHELNERLLHMGGHIGYGIRPSARGQGYATLMLELFLQQPQVRKIKKVLLTCDDGNIPSYKTIEACHGVLWDKVQEKRKIIRRYWITLTE